MFPYRVKYTESESDIQNNNLLYKLDPKCQNTFDCFKMLENNCNIKKKNIFCYMYKLHNSYLVFLEKFVILGFCDFFLYSTRVGLLHV